MTNPEEYIQLKTIHDAYKQKYYDFPVDFCAKTSKLLERKGYTIKYGWFICDIPFLQDGEETLSPHHYWAEKLVPVISDKPVIYDLTAYQFNNGLFKPLSPEPLIATPNMPIYWRYVPELV